MKTNNQSVIIVFMSMLIALTLQTQAQNSFVSWSSFNAGFAEVKTSNTMIKSVLGQNFVGTTQLDNTQIISGFLADTLFRGTLVDVENHEQLPTSYSLWQNYPNPFNPTTRIKYDLPKDSKVILKLYNLLGQEVVTLLDEIQDAGYKSVEWNANDIASGIYFYRLEANSVTDPSKSFTRILKMVLTK